MDWTSVTSLIANYSSPASSSPPPRHGQTIPPDCREYLKEFGNQWANIKIEKAGGPALAPGPYLYANKVLQSVCRLYDDEQGAILSTIKPNLGPYVSSRGFMLSCFSSDAS